MPDEPADGGWDDSPVSDAVRELLDVVARERGRADAELLQALLTGDELERRGNGPDDDRLDELEQVFRAMIEDVRERVIQVKRETDGKAPVDHSHDDLRHTVEQVSRELEALQTQIDSLDERLDAGFDNYEDILIYLTDTTDDLAAQLGEVAAAVIDLRDRIDESGRHEARQAALANLTQPANRHGVSTAKCENCSGSVDLRLLVEPRCPHCNTAFAELEPKRGLFRSAMLRTGSSVPALEAAEEEPDTAAALERIVELAASAESPEVATPPTTNEADPGEADAGSDVPDENGRESGDGDEAATPPAQDVTQTDRTRTPTEADGDLQAIDGIESSHADRLEAAGVPTVAALARADPQELGDAIGVHAWTVAEWVEQATEEVGSP